MKTPNDIDPWMTADVTPADAKADPFLEALRNDLPSQRDEATVRARLIAAGVMLTSAAATSSAAAGAAGAAQAVLVKMSLGSKVLALPFAAKLAAGTTLAVAVAVTGVSVVTHDKAARDPAPHDTPAQAQALGSLDNPGMATGEPRVAPASMAPAATVQAPRANPPTRVSAAAHPPALGASPKPPLAAGPPTRPASMATLPHPPSASVVPPTSATPGQPSTTLLEETRLIQQALSALGEEDRTSAQYWLAEHARRFPDGLLSPERQRALERLRQAGGSR